MQMSRADKVIVGILGTSEFWGHNTQLPPNSGDTIPSFRQGQLTVFNNDEREPIRADTLACGPHTTAATVSAAPDVG